MLQVAAALAPVAAAPPPPPPQQAAAPVITRTDGRVIATPYAKQVAKDLKVSLHDMGVEQSDESVATTITVRVCGTWCCSG